MPEPSAAAWWGALGVLHLAVAPTPVPLPPHPPAPPAVEVPLEWSAPGRCPTQSAVRERLERTLVGVAADPRGLRARATVSEGDGGALTMELVLVRDDEVVGQRIIQGHECEKLAAAAVLILVLAVDPVISTTPPSEPPPDDRMPETGDGADVVPPTPGEPLEPGPAPEPEPPRYVAPRPEPVAPPRAAPVARTRTSAGLRLGAGAGLSVLTGASALVSAGAAVWRRALRIELGTSYWTPVEVRPPGSTEGGRLQQWTIDARGCGLVRAGPLELPLCSGLDVGAVFGVGVGVTAPRRATSLRLAFAAGAALVWRPARWKQRVGPWIGADLLVALVRARFRATPASPDLVHHTPSVGGRVAAGIEVRFR